MNSDPLAPYARYPSLQDRVAFVSGGATGLGAEFVMQLAAQGARVAFVDIDRASGTALAAAVASRGYGTPRFTECDVRDIPALRAALADTAEHLGPVTVLVNNAANDQRHRIEDLSVEEWDDGIAVNVRHHFFAIQAVAPMMRDAGGGSVINLGSISAHIDLLDLPAYITSKAGIEGLTKTLARELGPHAIRVNCIIPGWIMTQRQLDNWVTPEAAASIDRNQCLKHRLYPDDVARLLLWLAADDSRSCTGQNWIVDGGWIK
jgi:NAD(P)-dependent dehydrogenase (short-subunit alcohol dehydrogenase family)